MTQCCFTSFASTIAGIRNRAPRLIAILRGSTHSRVKLVSGRCFGVTDEPHFLTAQKHIKTSCDGEAQTYANDWGVLGLVGMQATDLGLPLVIENG